MDRYALIIGVSEYQRLKPLPKASTDADKVAQVLEEYGGYQVKRLPERWNSLENRFEVGNGKVTGLEVGQELETLLLEKATKSDALVYFAGHGFTVLDNLKEQQGFLATSDCQVEIVNQVPINQKYGISLESLNKLIAKSDLRSLVMLLDCCHSGYFLERQLVQQTLSVFSFQKDYYLITACRNFETAKALSGEPNSIFTGAILKGLAANNANNHGIVTGDRLFDCINTELDNNLARQEPIRLGWGKAIPLVTYPPPEIVPNPVQNGIIQRENPYLGLRAFECSDGDYFFGREDCVRALLDLLKNGRFLAVIGPSGCGKSSLVKAGLFMALKQDKIPGSRHWQIQSLTPGMRPFEALQQALEQPSNQPLLLFIDQFEEIFTLCSNEIERKNFISCLSQETTRSERMIRVVVAMRGDFLDRCAAYQEIAELINRTQPTTYVVTPLTPKELEEVIEKPAQKHGIEFEWGLVGEIIADVVDQPGALPLLQYALAELWRVCITESTELHPMLTCQGYQQIGGVKGALEKKADELYHNLAPADQIFVHRLFLELVQLGEGKEVTRRRATWQELAALADSSEQLQRVTRLLAGQQERLIMTDEKTIEVAHEALLTEWRLLLDWIEQDRENIRLSRRLRSECNEWEKHCHSEGSEGLLLTGTWLAAIENWVETTQPRLGNLEQEFLQKSVEKRDKEIQEELAQERELRELAEARQKEAEARAIVEIEKSLEAEARAKAEAQKAQEAQARAKAEKRGKQIARISGVVLAISTVVAVGLASWAFWEKNRAVEAQKKEVDALISQAEKLLRNDNQIDALIASLDVLDRMEKLGIKDQDKLRKIQSVISNVQELNKLKLHEGAAYAVSFSPDGKFLASGGKDKVVKLWNLQDNTVEDLKSHGDYIRSIRFSFDSQFLASASLDKSIKIWNNQGRLVKTFDYSNRVYDLSFSPKSQKIAAAGKDGEIRIWDINSSNRSSKILKNTILETANNKEYKIYGLDFNPINDSILVSTGFEDYEIMIWNLNSNNEPKRISKTKFVTTSVRFSKDGSKIVTCDNEGFIRIRDSLGNLIGVIKDSENYAYYAEFSQDGKFIASTSMNNSIKIWNVEKALKLWSSSSTKELKDPEIELKEANSGSIYKISFHYNFLKTFASVSDDGIIRIWDFQKGNINKKKNLKVLELQKEGCNHLKNYFKISSDFVENKLICDRVLKSKF